MRFPFQQQVVTGITVSIVLVILVGLSSYNALIIQHENASMVNHTRDVMRSSEAVKNLLLTTETNIRGFVITKHNMFETSYQNANQKILDEFNALRNLVSDNPAQVARLDTLSIILHNKLDLMSSQLDILKSDQYTPDTLRALILKGKSLSSKIDFNFSRIENTEQALLVERELKAQESSAHAKLFIVFGSAIFFLVILLLFYFIRKTYNAQIASEGETKKVNAQLEKISIADQETNWVLSASANVSVAIRGEPSKNELAAKLVKQLAETTGAMVAVMYLKSQNSEHLELEATHGVNNKELVPKEVFAGQGILGQIFADKTSFHKLEVIPGYFQVVSGTGRTNPGTVFIKSFIFEGNVLGIIEMAFLFEPASTVIRLFDMISDNTAIALMAVRARATMQHLLDQTQKQAEELESQQEQLSITNEDLTRQTSLLQVSEEELRVQQEELKQINTVLEEKALMLEEQKSTLEEARDQLELKADELERSGKFKSEFLANMSHELRTPLNSILILSRILEENKGSRFSTEEQRYASVIHNSGSDLLTLINDILDLAKVEAGKVELHHENINMDFLLGEVRNTFQKVAENKGLMLEVRADKSCPATLYLDHVRLQQILRNLLSNAIKFTSAPGKVSLTIAQENGEWRFAVADSGIGIPLEKQEAIFEAFQQADGSISRKFGGTGLGLSITKELAGLFNGKVSLKSIAGEGSVFTVSIPVIFESDKSEEVLSADEKSPEVAPLPQRALVQDEHENRLLLIEDDPFFAADMAEKARNSGFSVSLAETGKQAMELVTTFKPTAIILDMHLPDISGEELLRQLKSDSTTRTIPVHTVSAGEESDFSREGAIGFMQKPVNRKAAEGIFDLLKLEGKNRSKQRILLIEDDTLQSKYVGDFLSENDIFVLYAYSAEEARTILSRESVDGIILDIRLTDANGLDFLDEIKTDPHYATLPVIINTAEDLSQKDLARVMKYAHPVVMKTRKSNERLLDEVKLFLKNIRPKTPAGVVTKGTGNLLVHSERVFVGKKILIADDDMRNIFALSAVLEDAGFTIVIAMNGKEAIQKLEEESNIELVLMDVMMPEMDGIEATRSIRSQSKWLDLPIIAVTAKAMQGDRQQCLAAGANDYVSKPIDVDKLLSLIKVWLHAA
jgi:signal transduction histidine kinase/DNA-binding response OmpR family regulator/CHASE3 domain sensor protein